MCTTKWPNSWDKGCEGDTWKPCVTTTRLNINLSGREKQFDGRKKRKEKKEKERKRKGRKTERKEKKEKDKKEKEKKERTSRFFFDQRRFDGRNSSDQETKSVYTTKATRGYRKQKVSTVTSHFYRL